MKRHSLIFGVQDYPGTGNLPALTAPNDDVDGLVEVLSDPLYMGDVGKIKFYKNLRHSEARQAFADFFDDIDPQDIVLIYFSGHGLRDDPGDLYLCFIDSNENRLDLTAQRAAEIGEWLDRRKFQRTVIILDCCYSGAAGAQLTKDSISNQLAAIEKPRQDGTGRYVLSSSGAAETSKEIKGRRRSAFTHHLIEGIRSGAADANSDGSISVSELADYLHLKVPEDAVGQLPQLNSRKVSGTFVVACNPIAIEAEKQKRAAEAVAECARERAALDKLALDSLKKHVAFGSIDLDFAGDVQSWLEAHGGIPLDNPRLVLLRDFCDGRLSAIKFDKKWQTYDDQAVVVPTRPQDQSTNDVSVRVGGPVGELNSSARHRGVDHLGQETLKPLSELSSARMLLVLVTLSSVAYFLVTYPFGGLRAAAFFAAVPTISIVLGAFAGLRTILSSIASAFLMASTVSIVFFSILLLVTPPSGTGDSGVLKSQDLENPGGVSFLLSFPFLGFFLGWLWAIWRRKRTKT